MRQLMGFVASLAGSMTRGVTLLECLFGCGQIERHPAMAGFAGKLLAHLPINHAQSRGTFSVFTWKKPRTYFFPPSDSIVVPILTRSGPKIKPQSSAFSTPSSRRGPVSFP